MKLLFLNPPYHTRIMRRYITSYYAPNFLLPPYELMSLATIAKVWKNAEVDLMDAIAEDRSLENVIENIRKLQPDIIISMPGFESFSDDMEALSHIKTINPGIKICVFGYLPSLFPDETLRNTNLDIVIRGEPELTFSYLYDTLKNAGSLRTILGISFREGGAIINNPAPIRINELNILPFPDPCFINLKLYREPYLGTRMMALYSSRGCSEECTYCIKSFGQKVFCQTPEITVKALNWYLEKFKIKNFRFLDENFTIDRNRVLEICKHIIEQKLDITWTCLSRIDTLDYGIAKVMRDAGCKRIYLGIESASDKILKFYKKNYSISDIRLKVNMLRKIGLDFVGFFIVGAPIETDEDVKISINLAIEENFDFILVTRLKFIPGTQLFEQYKDKIKFSLFPYKAIYESSQYEEKTLTLEKLFYRKFYFRLRYYLKKLKLIFISPMNIIVGAHFLKQFLKGNKNRDFV